MMECKILQSYSIESLQSYPIESISIGVGSFICLFMVRLGLSNHIDQVVMGVVGFADAKSL